jgi:hypothetical protein
MQLSVTRIRIVHKQNNKLEAYLTTLDSQTKMLKDKEYQWHTQQSKSEVT